MCSARLRSQKETDERKVGLECVIQYFLFLVPSCFLSLLSSEYETLLKVNQEALQQEIFHMLTWEDECCRGQ